jgi:hypothetical protein
MLLFIADEYLCVCDEQTLRLEKIVGEELETDTRIRFCRHLVEIRKEKFSV